MKRSSILFVAILGCSSPSASASGAPTDAGQNEYAGPETDAGSTDAGCDGSVGLCECAPYNCGVVADERGNEFLCPGSVPYAGPSASPCPADKITIGCLDENHPFMTFCNYSLLTYNNVSVFCCPPL